VASNGHTPGSAWLRVGLHAARAEAKVTVRFYRGLARFPSDHDGESCDGEIAPSHINPMPYRTGYTRPVSRPTPKDVAMSEAVGGVLIASTVARCRDEGLGPVGRDVVDQLPRPGPVRRAWKVLRRRRPADGGASATRPRPVSAPSAFLPTARILKEGRRYSTC